MRQKGGERRKVCFNYAIHKHISLNINNDMDDYEMDLVLAIAMNVSSCVQT